MIEKLPVILASGSPRRQELLKALGVHFRTLLKPVDENYPDHLTGSQVPLFLAEKKALAYDKEVEEQNIIITADTVVCLDDLILGKPEDFDDGVRILKMLSGRKHDVITAVCIRSFLGTQLFHDTTAVYFRELSESEIRHYMDTGKPYDKAGSYGIQDWIGLIGIERIDGSYHNVVGLPVGRVYSALLQLASRWPQ